MLPLSLQTSGTCAVSEKRNMCLVAHTCLQSRPCGALSTVPHTGPQFSLMAKKQLHCCAPTLLPLRCCNCTMNSQRCPCWRATWQLVSAGLLPVCHAAGRFATPSKREHRSFWVSHPYWQRLLSTYATYRRSSRVVCCVACDACRLASCSRLKAQMAYSLWLL